MYRALALCFLDAGIAPGETQRMISACEDAVVSIRYENGVQQVYLNGRNVTSRIREEAVNNMASVGSTVPQVRAKLLELQRNWLRGRCDWMAVISARTFCPC